MAAYENLSRHGTQREVPGTVRGSHSNARHPDAECIRYLNGGINCSLAAGMQGRFLSAAFCVLLRGARTAEWPGISAAPVPQEW
jgi:hypothetical protein